MRAIIILFLSIMVVAANVCENDSQATGSPLSGRFGSGGYSEVFLLDIFEDQQRGLLYFIGYFRPGAPPWDTIIYKSDYNLTKIKVTTYNIYGQIYSYAMDGGGDLIYIQDHTTSKIMEIKTADLLISREISVNVNSNMDMRKGFYFSFGFLSALETCRWDTSTTNLDWFNFGVSSHTNLVSISADLLFFGSIDSSADHYYLINYNFSDPSTLVWKKSIEWPISSCASKISSSILSEDEQWIYIMVLFNNNYIFYKLSVADGTPHNPGFIWNDNGYYWSYSMKEFNNFIAVVIRSTSLSPNFKRLILVSRDNTKILREYKSITSRLYAVGRLLYNGEELMYHCGRIQSPFQFFFARSGPNNIDLLDEFEEDSTLFTPLTTTYQISETTSTPSITSSTKTLIISTSTSITTNDITSTTNPSFTTHVALWNDDHFQSVQSNTSVLVDFTWAWAQSENYTTISFSLAPTESNEIPEWVNLDTQNKELRLNRTPRLEKAQTYYFSLQISFNSEVYYKKFEITVEEWNIEYCDVWQLGNPSLWETWKAGYQGSNEQKSCSKITAPTGTTETATALITLSIILSTSSSALSLTSINSIFSVMNSLQLAILLPLVPDYFSLKVLDFLSGMSFTMLSFDFIKFKDIPFVKAIADWVSYPQSDEYLNSLGLRSGSSVINYLSMMAILILIGVAHLGISLWNKWNEDAKHGRIKKCINKLFLFFSFNIYIRIFIQAFAFTTLSIFSELYNLNLNTVITKISFGFWVMFGMCTSVLFILSFYMYKKSFPQFDESKYWPWTEYFNGIKLTTCSKLYSSLFMTLRLILCCLLIFGESMQAFYKSTFFSAMNIAYFIYLTTVRPFTNPQDSIVEIINQALFSCLAIPLLWINTEQDWTPLYESYYMTIFMVSPAIWSLIWLIFLLKSIWSYCSKRKSNKYHKSITPKETSKKRKPKRGEIEQSANSSIVCSSFKLSRSNASMVNHAKNKRTNKFGAQPIKVLVKSHSSNDIS